MWEEREVDKEVRGEGGGEEEEQGEEGNESEEDKVGEGKGRTQKTSHMITW